MDEPRCELIATEDAPFFKQISRKIMRGDFEAAIRLKLWDELLSVVDVGSPRLLLKLKMR